MGRNHEFDPSLRNLSIKCLLARHVSHLFSKLGGFFGASFCHLSNVEIVLRSEMGYAHGDSLSLCMVI